MYASAAACINNKQSFSIFFLSSFFEKWQKLESMLHRTGDCRRRQVPCTLRFACNYKSGITTTFLFIPRRPRPQPLAPGPGPSLSYQAWTQNKYMYSPLIVLNKITVKTPIYSILRTCQSGSRTSGVAAQQLSVC